MASNALGPASEHSPGARASWPAGSLGRAGSRPRPRPLPPGAWAGGARATTSMVPARRAWTKSRAPITLPSSERRAGLLRRHAGDLDEVLGRGRPRFDRRAGEIG